MGKMIYVERMEHRPGIYIIFNRRTLEIYIGQARRMKERVLQHVRNLYLNEDNNKTLQNEFNDGKDNYYMGCLRELDDAESLNRWEGIYYQVCKDLYGKERLYNQNKPPKISSEIKTEEREIAENTIRSILKKKADTKGLKRFTSCGFAEMRDWIPREVLDELGIQSRSLKQMFENHEIDFLLFGKAGDYIGADKPDTICETLRKKIDELNSAENERTRRCLWETSGPDPDIFSRWLSLYHRIYGEDKKVYVLFEFTINRYKQGSDKKETTFCWECDGVRYKDTVPSNKKNAKALVIKNFYAVEEDFNFGDLQDVYYRFDTAALHTSMQKYKLNSNNLSRLTLYASVLNSLIVDAENEEIRQELGFSDAPYLLEEFMKSRNISGQSEFFPTCDENHDHPVYYLLAEVENYVPLRPLEER